MPDDARATTREQVDWSYDFIAENPGDALDEIDRLSNLNKELLAALASIDELLSHPGNTQSATIAWVRRVANEAIAQAKGGTVA